MTGGYRGSFRALSSVVGLVTAHLGDVDVEPADLLGEVPEQEVIRTLTLVLGGVLSANYPPAVTDQILRELGEEAARVTGNAGG